MEKKHFIFAFISGVVFAAGMMTVSCGPSEHEKALQAEVDSIHRADSIARAKLVADSINKAKEMNFSTPDLKLFNLKGHVKSVVTSHSDYYSGHDSDLSSYLSPEKLSYDENGNLEVSADGYKAVRDNKGRLLKLKPNQGISPDDPDLGVLTINYNNDGYPALIELNCDDATRTSATFNSEGLPQKVTVTGYSSAVYKYSYTDFDNHGNWIKRQVKYSYKALYDNESDVNTTFTETRLISYYK